MDDTVSNASSNPQPLEENGKQDFPYFFSTEGNKKPPRFLGADNPPPVARSDVSKDIKDFVSNLRSKWPLECWSIFTDPSIPTGFDLRWFFDEYDAHILGCKFLFNVICNIIEGNKKEVVVFAQAWAHANREKFDHFPYILFLQDGIDLVFNLQDRELRGEVFLKHVLCHLQEAYLEACRDAESQATSQPSTRMTNLHDSMDISRIQTATGSEFSRVPAHPHGHKRATSNMMRKVSVGYSRTSGTPTMAYRQTGATPKPNSARPQYQNEPLSHQFPWGAPQSLINAFQGQVPQFPSPAQFTEQHGGIAPPVPSSGYVQTPSGYYPPMLPVPAHGQGQLPFPGVPTYQPVPGQGPDPMCYQPLYGAPTYPMLPNMPPGSPTNDPQHMSHMANADHDPWVRGFDSTSTPQNVGERSRKNSATRGRGRGSMSNRGNRRPSSSSHGNSSGYDRWGKDNNERRSSMSYTEVAPHPVPLGTLPETSSNARVRPSATTPGKGTKTPLSTSNDNHFGPKYMQPSRDGSYPRKNPPLPLDEHGNLDRTKAVGARYVGENVEDLFDLFISGVVGLSETDIAQAFEPYAVVQRVRFLSQDGTHGFVTFFKTLDVREVLKQLDHSGHFYLQRGNLTYRFQLEVPRTKQHLEFELSYKNLWKPKQGGGTYQSPEQNRQAGPLNYGQLMAGQPVPGQSSPGLPNTKGGSPTKKGKKKGENKQPGTNYTSQDVRSQFPPDKQVQRSSPTSRPITEPTPPMQPTWAKVASTVPDVAKNVGGLNKKGTNIGEATQSAEGNLTVVQRPQGQSESEVLRDVHNRPSQVRKETTVLATPCASKPEGTNSKLTESRAIATSSRNDTPSKMSDLNVEGPTATQRQSSGAVFPVLPLKSPSVGKSISASDELGGGSGSKTPSPTKIATSESDTITAARSDDAELTGKDAPLATPDDENFHDAPEHPQTPSRATSTTNPPHSNPSHQEQIVTKEEILKQDEIHGRVSSATDLVGPQGRFKKSKAKKKKRGSAAPTISEAGISSPLANTAVENNTPIDENAESEVLQHEEQVSDCQNHVADAEISQHEEEPPNEVNVSTELGSIEAADKATPNTVLDPGTPNAGELKEHVPAEFVNWRDDYDNMMKLLLKVKFRAQDGIGAEATKLKQLIVNLEEKIVEGDSKAFLSSSFKKKWTKRRKQAVEDYKSLVDENLPLLIEKIKVRPHIEHGTISEPSDNTSPRTSTPTEEFEVDVDQLSPKARRFFSAHLRGGAAEEKNTVMEQAIKGERREQSPFLGIRQAMEKVKAISMNPDPIVIIILTPPSSGTEDGLGITGIDVPTIVNDGGSESATTDSTLPQLEDKDEFPVLNESPSRSGGEDLVDPASKTTETKLQGQSVVSPSKPAVIKSYASAAKQAVTNPFPSIGDVIWSNKAKVLDDEVGSSGSHGPTPVTGSTNPVSRRNSNAVKPKAGGDDEWAVRQGEGIWDEKGFRKA